jgi:PTS system nitrogen regulatory IIA component
MQLKFSEAVGFLGVPEATARRWIKNRGLPVHRVDERLFVNPVELWEWATEQQLPVSPDLLTHALRERVSVPPISTLLQSGGIHHAVPGASAAAVLHAVVARLPLPAQVDRAFLATALTAREAMGSTGVGYGIAIPHVRNPILLHVEEPFVSLALLAHPVDFGAADGRPVHALFTVISPTVPTHLRILAQLSLLLRDESLRRLLERNAPDPELMAHIGGLEHPDPGAPASARTSIHGDHA